MFELAAGAGAVGVPVNEGELIFAFKATSELKDVILEVFDSIEFVLAVKLEVTELIFELNVVILDVLDAIVIVLVVKLTVFVSTLLDKAVILFVLAVTLVSIALILAKLEVILAVFEAIVVGKVAIVAELTPPTLFTTGAVAVPPKSFVN